MQRAVKQLNNYHFHQNWAPSSKELRDFSVDQNPALKDDGLVSGHLEYRRKATAIVEETLKKNQDPFEMKYEARRVIHDRQSNNSFGSRQASNIRSSTSFSPMDRQESLGLKEMNPNPYYSDTRVYLKPKGSSLSQWKSSRSLTTSTPRSSSPSRFSSVSHSSSEQYSQRQQEFLPSHDQKIGRHEQHIRERQREFVAEFVPKVQSWPSTPVSTPTPRHETFEAEKERDKHFASHSVNGNQVTKHLNSSFGVQIDVIEGFEENDDDLLDFLSGTKDVSVENVKKPTVVENVLEETVNDTKVDFDELDDLEGNRNENIQFEEQVKNLSLDPPFDPNEVKENVAPSVGLGNDNSHLHGLAKNVVSDIMGGIENDFRMQFAMKLADKEKKSESIDHQLICLLQEKQKTRGAFKKDLSLKIGECSLSLPIFENDSPQLLVQMLSFVGNHKVEITDNETLE